jgi:uncharacterized membrane protein YccF (DUF307 family)
MAALRAALIAGTTAALLIFNAVVLLGAFGPAELIPSLAPHALTPADRLANSRTELVDPYLWLLLLGWFVAIGQWAAARAPAAPAVGVAPPAPAATAPSPG